MQIAIISDTHLPRGKRRLPGPCVERLRAADLILHAGDLMTLGVLRELESYGPVVAVHGNVDDAERISRERSIGTTPPPFGLGAPTVMRRMASRLWR